MANNFLKKNATGLAPTDFELADGTAGTGFVAGATLLVTSGGQTVDTACDQNAVNVNSFDVREGWFGNLGTEASHVKFQATNSAETASTALSRVRYWASGGFFYLDVVHATLGCHFLQVGNKGNLILCGGAVKHIHMDKAVGGQGSCYLKVVDGALAAASGIWQLMGGKSLVDVSSTGNLMATVNYVAGEHEFRRGGATINVNGANVVADIKNDSITTLALNAGQLELRSHHATGPALTALGGVLALGRLSRPIVFTNAVLGAVTITGFNPSLVTFTTPTIVGRGPIGLSGI